MRTAPLPSPPVLAGVRILVVEPDEDNAEVVAALLSAHGAAPITVNDKPSALAAVAAFEPHVIVAELEAEGAFLRAVRACYPMTLAVALTGYVTERDRARALAGGFDLFWPKPLDVNEAIPLLAERLRDPAGELVAASRAVHPFQMGFPISDTRTQQVYLPEAMLEEMRAEAARLGVSLSAVVELAWLRALRALRALPSTASERVAAVGTIDDSRARSDERGR